MARKQNPPETKPKCAFPAGLLTRLSDENLAAAVELNSAAHLRLQGRLPWVEFHDDVEVLEKFRGRGIGTALVAATLRHGNKLGYQAAVLGATGMGMGINARLGFREVCKLSFWKYGKMRQRGCR